MLYFLYGDNKDKAREKARELVESLTKKRPEAEFFKLEIDKFDLMRLQELIGGQGLFSSKYIVFLDSLFENTEIKEQVLKFYKEIGESENIFIWLESKVDKATLTKLEKFAKQVQKFEGKEEKKEEFNVFSLADALGRRDRKGLWVLYQKALQAEASTEAISGILFWKIKNLFENRSGNFTKEELKKLSSKLVTTYHEAHRGICDFNVAIERLILGL